VTRKQRPLIQGDWKQGSSPIAANMQKPKHESVGAVLFISHDASLTGAPLFLLRFLQWLRQNRQLSLQILVGAAGPLVPDFEALAPVSLFEPKPTVAYRILRRLRMNSSYRSAHLASLREQLAESNIRLIYANTIVNGKILDFLSFLGCPVICHVHELEQPIMDYGADNIDLVKKHANAYIAVSGAVKRNLVENHNVPASKIQMVHGFIPTAEYDAARDDAGIPALRQELGIANAAKLVCACGSIEPRKGTDLFLQVARKVVEAYKEAPVHFVWVGGRPESVDQMRNRVKAESLEDFVHFVGPKSDVGVYYSASDLFLLSSREDPFPLVMMEAALRGKPVVCFSGSGGASEFVEEEDAGFVVPGFDVDQMARRVAELLSAEELRRRMGSAARRKVLARHDIAIGASRISAIIDDALLASASADPKNGLISGGQLATLRES
jgi:glycosyltransferase involved in cell wall biosynthesis